MAKKCTDVSKWNRVEFLFESISLLKYSEYQEKQKSLLVELKVKFINQAYDIKVYDKTE